MDTFGNDLSYGGQVLSKSELISRRERNGECITCGQKCYNKKLFKMVPITIPGVVLEGRCLACNPQDPNKEEVVASCVAVPAATRRGGRKQRKMSKSVGHHASSEGFNSLNRTLTGESSENSPNKLQVAAEAAMIANPRRGALASSAPASVPLPLPPAGRTTSDLSRDRNNRFRVAADAVVATSHRHEAHDNHQNDSLPQRGQLREHQQGSARRDTFTQQESRRPSEIMFAGLNLNDFGDSDDDHAVSSNSQASSERESRSKRPSVTERKALAAIANPNNTSLDILNIMLTNSTSMVIQNEGLHALSLVLRNPTPSLLKDIQHGCGYEVIVSAMGICAGDAMAQTNACKVLFLAGAAGDVKHQIAIASAGGVDALGDAMKKFDNDMIVLEGCLLALSNLCIPEDNLQYFFEENLIETTVGVMSRSVENCGLQEHGCAVLANLALHDCARSRIREAGGCDTIVVSMVVNPMDVEVQSQALVALRNLCAKDEENRILLANAGAVDACIGAMQCHRNDAKIQERGSWVLSILGANDDNKLYIGENGGIDVIVRSMWVHPDNAGVQEKALRALWTLSVDKELRWPIVEVNTISAVVAAMQAHSDDASVQEKGCGVLANLAASSTKLKTQIVKEGCLDVVVMAMVLHGENEVLNERAVLLIKKLCISDNAEAMINANVSPVMTMVAETFPSCQEKARMILDFLGDGGN